MRNKQLYKKGNQIIRVLKTDEDRVLVIDCIKRTMPKWTELSQMKEFIECSEEELLEAVNIIFEEVEEMSETRIKVMNQRYSMISGIVMFIGNQNLRTEAIAVAEKEYDLAKQTIRQYLCEYLAFNDVRALAPRKREEKPLTEDEKNMRWSLNKFYYSMNKNSLKTAYTLMLKHKYCDAEGKLLDHYPSYCQFRYFFRKTKNIQRLYITREGLTAYQRDKRPLLGDGVRAFAPCIGTAMLDSTVCDIYLINEAGQIVGRPILTVAVDAYSGLCLGYSLTWQGGVYTLRNLMLNIISDKVKHCKRFGIDIATEDWNVSELPVRLITDKGSEYKSENFEQLAELGLKIENLPAYRAELKGSVEKFFDCVQSYYKPYLKGKGVIEPDFQERGKHDYRKDASLTLQQFEAVLLHCILFYNTKRILKDFPFTEEMLEENISPYPNVLWNMQKVEGAELIKVSAEKLMKTLLPRTTAKFKRNGLNANGLRYKNLNYNEKYLEGNEVTVAFNPDDVGRIWLIENGSYIEFELIEERFKGKELEDVQQMKSKQKELCKKEKENMTQAEIDLAEHILVIREQAQSNSNKSTKNIRKTRQREQKKLHKDYMKEVCVNE